MDGPVGEALNYWVIEGKALYVGKNTFRLSHQGLTDYENEQKLKSVGREKGEVTDHRFDGSEPNSDPLNEAKESENEFVDDETRKRNTKAIKDKYGREHLYERVFDVVSEMLLDERPNAVISANRAAATLPLERKMIASALRYWADKHMLQTPDHEYYFLSSSGRDWAFKREEERRVEAQEGRNLDEMFARIPDQETLKKLVEFQEKAMSSESPSDNTKRLLDQGPKAFREFVRLGFERATGGDTRQIIQFRDLAKDLELEEMEVGHALEYWVKEGKAVRMTVGGFSLSHQGMKEMEERQEQQAQLETDRAHLEKLFVGRNDMPPEEENTLLKQLLALGPKPLPPDIFIGHGRSKVFFEVESHIKSEFQAEVQTFERVATPGDQVIPTLERLLNECGFAVMIATAEDEAKIKASESDQATYKMRARQNVVHEIGLFQGRHGFDRVVVLLENGVEKFTNGDGQIYVPFSIDNVSNAFVGLDKALRRAKYKHKEH